MLGDRLRTKPPSSDGACRFDLSGDKEEKVFFVLGFLDESLGRYIVEDDDRVERLYSVESELVAVLWRQLAKLATQRCVDTGIREEGPSPGPIVFPCSGRSRLPTGSTPATATG